MICRTGLLVLLAFLLSTSYLQAQAPEILISKVRAKLEKVNDYVAKGKMKTNVIFIKAPVASVKIFYKRPDKMRINNETGISFIPKGSVNINLNNIFTSGSTEFDLIDLGRENGTYELEMSYGKYADYGLADKLIFSFNTKDYKLPKGVTFDYDDGEKKPDEMPKVKNRKGKVEIVYSGYTINKGVPDSVFL